MLPTTVSYYNYNWIKIYHMISFLVIRK